MRILICYLQILFFFSFNFKCQTTATTSQSNVQVHTTSGDTTTMMIIKWLLAMNKVANVFECTSLVCCFFFLDSFYFISFALHQFHRHRFCCCCFCSAFFQYLVVCVTPNVTILKNAHRCNLECSMMITVSYLSICCLTTVCELR